MGFVKAKLCAFLFSKACSLAATVIAWALAQPEWELSASNLNCHFLRRLNEGLCQRN